MLPLAHIGIALIAAKHLKQYGLPLVATAFFAFFPDLVDKGLFFLGFAPATRFIAHSIFFAPIIAALLFFFLKKTKFAGMALPISVAALFGGWLHLLLDAYAPLPLFFPLLSYPFQAYSWDLSLNVMTALFELIGLCCLLFVAMESQGD